MCPSELSAWGHLGAPALYKFNGLGGVKVVNWLSTFYGALGKQQILVPCCWLEAGKETYSVKKHW